MLKLIPDIGITDLPASQYGNTLRATTMMLQRYGEFMKTCQHRAEMPVSYNSTLTHAAPSSQAAQTVWSIFTT